MYLFNIVDANILFYKFTNEMLPFLCHLTTYVLMVIIIHEKKLGALQVQPKGGNTSFGLHFAKSWRGMMT
jgi:hypothetical protein